MTYLDKQEFLAWAYDDLLTNTTRGVLAEYIVAKALGIRDTKRVEWDKYDLVIGDIGVEVKSAAYVQTWKQTRLSEIAFGIRPAKGWDARTNTSAASAERSADVYVFCLLDGYGPRTCPPARRRAMDVLRAADECSQPKRPGAEDDSARTAESPRSARVCLRRAQGRHSRGSSGQSRQNRQRGCL